jgi:hypothetical protein
MMTVAAPPNGRVCRSLETHSVVAFQPMNDLALQAGCSTQQVQRHESF